jgi:hypothetical protein
MFAAVDQLHNSSPLAEVTLEPLIKSTSPPKPFADTSRMNIGRQPIKTLFTKTYLKMDKQMQSCINLCIDICMACETLTLTLTLGDALF